MRFRWEHRPHARVSAGEVARSRNIYGDFRHPAEDMNAAIGNVRLKPQVQPLGHRGLHARGQWSGAAHLARRDEDLELIAPPVLFNELQSDDLTSALLEARHSPAGAPTALPICGAYPRPFAKLTSLQPECPLERMGAWSDR